MQHCTPRQEIVCAIVTPLLMNERGQIRSKKMCAARVLKESLQVCCCFTFLRRLSITVRKTWDTIRPIPTASSRAEMTPTAGIRHDLRVMSAMQPLRLLLRMNGTSRSQAWVMLGKKVYGPRSSHVFVGGWMQDSCNAQPFSARCCEAGSYRWEGVQTSERLSDETVSWVPGLNCVRGGAEIKAASCRARLSFCQISRLLKSRSRVFS